MSMCPGHCPSRLCFLLSSLLLLSTLPLGSTSITRYRTRRGEMLGRKRNRDSNYEIRRHRAGLHDVRSVMNIRISIVTETNHRNINSLKTEITPHFNKRSISGATLIDLASMKPRSSPSNKTVLIHLPAHLAPLYPSFL